MVEKVEIEALHQFYKTLSEFDGHNQMALSRKYGYSQKWVYKVLKRRD